VSPGYSGTPLAAKIGIKDGTKVHVVGAPKEYAKLLARLPAGAAINTGFARDAKLLHVFVTQKKDLAAQLKNFRKTLSSDAVVWVSWPKQSAKVATDVTEDTIREVALPLGFVDVKVCAVSEVWSGLKLVVRKELR